jgi:hypothetical protein
MSGASSRRKGHAFEVKCAKVLRGLTGLDIRTTRELGASYGADLCTVTGYDKLGRPAAHIPTVLDWSVECKAVVGRSPGAWLKQAEEQAIAGATPVVIWRRKNYPFEKGSAFTRAADGSVYEETLAQWILLVAQSPILKRVEGGSAQ